MKIFITLLFCIAGFTGYAQTSTQLLGKWKLVKSTRNGVVDQPKDTYQVFRYLRMEAFLRVSTVIIHERESGNYLMTIKN